MKKVLFLLLLPLVQFHAQTNINADCINAIPLCSTPNFTFNATSGVGNVADIPAVSNISNPNTNPASSNAGCLQSGELKPQWLLITIGNPGNLEFVFGAANSANPQVGFYDWAMWPYTALTCQNIQNNTLPPIRCNWNASNSGGTGIASAANQPPGSSAGNFEPPLAVQACQQFIICISNYSGVNTLVSFLSLGTASLTCNPSCINVTSPTLCAGSTASIVAVSSGLTGITYSINPGGASSPTPTFAVNPTANTDYTIYATGLNSSNVAITQSAVSSVTVYPSPQAAPTATQATCLNPTNAFSLGLTFIPSNATPNYSIAWSPTPTGVVSTTQTALTGTMAPGVYNATITMPGGCSTVSGFTINTNPPPANIIPVPPGPNYVVTCFNPTVTVNMQDAANNYTWSNNSNAPITGATAAFDHTTTGTWTIVAENPVSGCIATATISVSLNTLAPTALISPTFQNITCNQSSVLSVTATANLTVNVSHLFSSPQGASVTAQTYSTIYTPGGPGTYTHCVIDNVNGCSTCKEFTVFSNQGFPTFNVTSPQSFTLGCNSKNFALLKIENGSTSLPPGGPVSYTILAPGAATATPPGSLGPGNVFTVTTPGTWTLITKDDNTFCETRVPVSVISNTAGPGIDTLIIPKNVLNCAIKQITLEAISEKTNVAYNWKASANTNIATNTLVVETKPEVDTQTLIANYTLSITDPDNACITTTIIPIMQNLFPPKALITSAIKGVSCKTNKVVLTNSSDTGIPDASPFPHNLPAVGELWEGPSPQQPLQKSTVYQAFVPGDYTMTALDLNNGCTAKAVFKVNNDRSYPQVNSPSSPTPFVLDCATTSSTISPIITSETTALVYNWSAPATAATSDKDKKQLITNKTGVYRVVTTNTANGCASLGEVKVIDDALTASVTPDVEQGYAPLTVSFTNLSESMNGLGNIVSAWSFGNGTYSITNSASVSPSTIYNSAGTFTVKVFMAKGHCLDTVVKVISVELPSQLTVPNIFTPNGDGVNDLFFLKATNLSKINMVIYNRWGQVVYEVQSFSGNIAWDGKSIQGKELADGNYAYLLKAEGKDGQGFEKRGTITLIR